jgi:hypothetical protein
MNHLPNHRNGKGPIPSDEAGQQAGKPKRPYIKPAVTATKLSELSDSKRESIKDLIEKKGS